MNYEYEWGIFDSLLDLTRFLNNEKIPKENIIKIETDKHHVELIYIKKVNLGYPHY